MWLPVLRKLRTATHVMMVDSAMEHPARARRRSRQPHAPQDLVVDGFAEMLEQQ